MTAKIGSKEIVTPGSGSAPGNNNPLAAIMMGKMKDVLQKKMTKKESSSSFESSSLSSTDSGKEKTEQAVEENVSKEEEDALDDDDSFQANSTIKATKAARKRRQMKERAEKNKRRWFMFYPEDNCLANWNIVMTIILLVTCLVTPWKIAFSAEADFAWEVINTIIDIFFGIDMLVIFNSAFYDDDNQL